MKDIDTNNLELQHDADYTMMKKVHDNLYLSQEQIEILESYDIDYQRCANIHELLYILEDMLNECDDDVLTNLADMLAERDYYENYNK